jgi:adenosylhomocysteine nucleosidase
MLPYRSVGLIGAMDEEIALLRRQMDVEQETAAAGIVFYRGRLADKPVILCKSGVGKVNAAMCAQIMIDRFQPEAVVFTGVAGALDPSLDIADVVVSSECMQHDMDASALGFPKGTIPFQDVSVFPADPRLVDAAFSAAEAAGVKAVIGRVLSGDQFIASRDTVRLLHEEMGGTCTEMEGAAVAQVCFMNRVPYVVIRSISDRADGYAHMDFAEFTDTASRQSSRIVETMLRK